jgi:hypothetical protein
MPQFRVVLDEIELSDEDHARINSSIQGAVLAELAKMDTGGDHATVLDYGPGIAGLIGYPICEPDPCFSRLTELREQFAR